MIYKKVKIILTKGLTAEIIHQYTNFNGAKYSSSNGLQNYLVIQLFIGHFLTKDAKIDSWILKWMSEKSVTFHLQQRKVFLQK